MYAHMHDSQLTSKLINIGCEYRPEMSCVAHLVLSHWSVANGVLLLYKELHSFNVT